MFCKVPYVNQWNCDTIDFDLNLKEVVCPLVIQMTLFSLFSKRIGTIEPSFQKSLWNVFLWTDNFHILIIILVTGICQSLEWVCEIGSYKQRCISCPSTRGQASHLGEWLQNHSVCWSSEMSSAIGLNLGLDQQKNPLGGLCAPSPLYLHYYERMERARRLTHLVCFLLHLLPLDHSLSPGRRWTCFLHWALGSATCLSGDSVTGVKFGPSETDAGELLVVLQKWISNPCNLLVLSFVHL